MSTIHVTTSEMEFDLVVPTCRLRDRIIEVVEETGGVVSIIH